MASVTSLPHRPLKASEILVLNDARSDMAVFPISYYEETKIYSIAVVTDEQASVFGFDGEEWTRLSRTKPDSDEVFDPEAVIDEWTRNTHPDLYDDPAFEVTSEDYDVE